MNTKRITKMRRSYWIKGLLEKLYRSPEMVEIYVIPGAIFALDLLIRDVIGVDLIDAGADMALLAVSTFFSLLIGSDERSQFRIRKNALIVFILVSLSNWIFCLSIISQDDILILTINFRLIIPLAFGLSAFMLSGAIANEFTRSISETIENKGSHD